MGPGDGRDNDTILTLLNSEAKRAKFGWDFTYLRGRMVESPLSWDYAASVQRCFPEARSLLDMGTGGGELLTSLGPLPPFTCATEGYSPNVSEARSRLAQIGVLVVRTGQNGELPFRAGSFDQVINRHSPYSPSEVFRVLRSDGRFVTQQVGHLNNRELNAALAPETLESAATRWDLETARTGLTEAGFEIHRENEAILPARFTDTGAIVWYLSRVPWQIPDFSVQTYQAPLLALYRQMERSAGFESRSHRFILTAIKP